MELLLEVLGESTWTVAVWVIRGDEGMGDIPGIQGGFRGSAGSVPRRLNCHKNSDLRSEVRTGTGLNSTTLRLIESMVLLTKLIRIVTPLILSVVVVVAQRLISYNGTHTRWYHTERQMQDSIVQRISQQIVSYMGFDEGKRRERKEAVQRVCIVSEA